MQSLTWILVPVVSHAGERAGLQSGVLLYGLCSGAGADRWPRPAAHWRWGFLRGRCAGFRGGERLEAAENLVLWTLL